MRIDLLIEDHPGFLIVTSGSAAEALFPLGDDPELVSLELIYNNPVIVRAVLGDLSPDEQASWVGRVTARVSAPCGRIVVVGGGSRSAGNAGPHHSLEVSPGDYLLEILTFPSTGGNGLACLEVANPSESVGAYFRRTRPEQPIPDWLAWHCFADPDLDPGHAADWGEAEAARYDALEAGLDERPLVDFLVRLIPLAGEAAVPPERTAEGSLPATSGARRPPRCPMDLPTEGTLTPVPACLPVKPVALPTYLDELAGQPGGLEPVHRGQTKGYFASDPSRTGGLEPYAIERMDRRFSGFGFAPTGELASDAWPNSIVRVYRRAASDVNAFWHRTRWANAGPESAGADAMLGHIDLVTVFEGDLLLHCTTDSEVQGQGLPKKLLRRWVEERGWEERDVIARLLEVYEHWLRKLTGKGKKPKPLEDTLADAAHVLDTLLERIEEPS